MRKLRCRIDMSGLRAVAGKVAWFATVEAGVLGKRCLRRSRSSSIPLLLRGPIVLRPLDVLLHWSNYHLMLSLWLKSRPGRCLTYHSGALGSTSRKSSCDLGLPLLKVMKTEIFLHGDGIIYQLIEILKMTAQMGPKFRTHSFQKTLSFLFIRIHLVRGIASQFIIFLDVFSNSFGPLL